MVYFSKDLPCLASRIAEGITAKRMIVDPIFGICKSPEAHSWETEQRCKKNPSCSSAVLPDRYLLKI